MFGDALEQLRVEDLRTGIGRPGFGKQLGSDHILLASGAPTNQQIIDATHDFYRKNQTLVDGTTKNTQAVSKNPAAVKALNRHRDSWRAKRMTTEAKDQTSVDIFGGKDGTGDGGLWGPALNDIKASQLFSTIAVGVNAEGIFGIGALGGLGCAWDIAKREGPKGYGYAALDLGLKVAVDVNVQLSIFNRLPSELNLDIFGLQVGSHAGLGVSFLMFFTSKKSRKFEILGYSIAIGIGTGGGAAVFGGHSWNFG